MNDLDLTYIRNTTYSSCDCVDCAHCLDSTTIEALCDELEGTHARLKSANDQLRDERDDWDRIYAERKALQARLDGVRALCESELDINLRIAIQLWLEESLEVK